MHGFNLKIGRPFSKYFNYATNIKKSFIQKRERPIAHAISLPENQI
jgi:hypothetical protein